MKFKDLEVLLLHNNRINDSQRMIQISKFIPLVQILTLKPKKDYKGEKYSENRHILVNSFKNLILLNDYIVSVEEIVLGLGKVPVKYKKYNDNLKFNHFLVEESLSNKQITDLNHAVIKIRKSFCPVCKIQKIISKFLMANKQIIEKTDNNWSNIWYRISDEVEFNINIHSNDFTDTRAETFYKECGIIKSPIISLDHTKVSDSTEFQSNTDLIPDHFKLKLISSEERNQSKSYANKSKQDKDSQIYDLSTSSLKYLRSLLTGFESEDSKYSDNIEIEDIYKTMRAICNRKLIYSKNIFMTLKIIMFQM
ncbi:MAG: leucine-rich repeat and IQ domain-containing protein 3 [Paramarteilia canceri]